ncbi:hypothetical protein B9Q11_02810 [Candidatus Marsarchaeota G2 archaeon ECH_B_SAG-F08]|uniref:Uncharacterized protein n=1 Tax=Candidatus Marsarchaeota G2 archaeon ECH_B_SAG-F08 TaxID=1978165 RepID=A0A2R6BHQ2_9ARCH|nr:MAG: hypothetical protein B9Q11_02810 [Candidatus Marsarchaeota G2 archaeon ECH_B_SAG-F08]
MIVELQTKNFSLCAYKLKGNLEEIQSFQKELILRNPDSFYIFSSEKLISPRLFKIAFYHACLRWLSGESISKKLGIEFFICLFGETQIKELLKIFELKPSKNIYLIAINEHLENLNKYKDNIIFEELNLNDKQELKEDERKIIAEINEKILKV